MAVWFERDPALPYIEAKRCTSLRRSYGRHFHEEFSIGFIERGTSNAWCDGRSLPVEAGEAIAFPPFIPHACNPDEDSDWTYTMLFIDPKWMEPYFAGDRCLQEPLLFDKAAGRRLKPLMDRSMSAFRTGGTPLEKEEAVIALMEAVCTDGARRIGACRGDGRKYALLVKAYMHEHFKEKITLGELELAAGASRFHLVRLFKEATGLPPHVYQNLLRISYAKKELNRGRTIAEAAAEAGFYDQSHFTRMFRRTVGVTPRKYAGDSRS